MTTTFVVIDGRVAPVAEIIQAQDLCWGWPVLYPQRDGEDDH